MCSAWLVQQSRPIEQSEERNGRMPPFESPGLKSERDGGFISTLGTAYAYLRKRVESMRKEYSVREHGWYITYMYKRVGLSQANNKTRAAACYFLEI
jgi:hypothetical protein